MIINRIWAMPNKNTFSILPIKQLIGRYIPKSSDRVIVDPFANDSKIGTITNDLNPEYDTDYHLDALDFLKMLDNKSADVILYDPPYSPRQVSECYNNVGYNVIWETTQASWRSKHLDEISRILKPDGLCFCFGWNTNGVGMKRGFEMIEILIVPHGGWHNDTICTVEKKIESVSTNTFSSMILKS